MGDTRIDQAKALTASGRHQEAMALLKAVLQENPQDGEARHLLTEVQDAMMLEMQIGQMLSKAKAFEDSGQSEQARKLVLDVLKVAPNHTEALAFSKRLSGAAQGGPPAGGGSPFDEGAFVLEALPTESTHPAAPAGIGEGLQSLPSMDDLAPLDFGAGPSATEATVLSGAAGSLSPPEAAKVRQYLQEGQDLLAKGQTQDAIDVWTRVFILDENNREADALISKAKEAMNANQGRIEMNLSEGIAAFNAGNYTKARPLLEQVLQVFPGHREAQHYLGLIAQRAPAPEPAAALSAAPPIAFEGFAPAAPPPSSSNPPLAAGSPDEFEFEDGVGQQKPAAPAPSTMSFGGFELESTGDLPDAVLPAAPSAPVAQPPAAESAAEVAPPPWGQSDGTPVAVPFPGDADAGGATPAGRTTARARAAAKPARSGPPWGMIIAAVVGLLVVGVGILVATKYLFGGEGSGTAIVAPSKIPKPSPPKVDTPPPPVTPAASAAADPKSMAPEELLKGARAAEAERDFGKAVAFYQELVARGGGLNTEAAAGLASARASYQKQQIENERNEKFLKDYQNATRSFKEGDFTESLRIAWRLIYPDDTLARQLGKREAIQRLIRDGYYNWAVTDLKSENVRGADKNLRDLLDFDKGDGEARKLQQFIKPYVSGTVDSNYRDVVKGLTYRPFVEGS